jgi:hypothetical protein
MAQIMAGSFRDDKEGNWAKLSIFDFGLKKILDF